MKWKPFVPGKPYTCQDCPAFVELESERRKWQQLAEDLMKWGDPPKMDWANREYRAAVTAYFEAIQGWSVHVCNDPEAVRGE